MRGRWYINDFSLFFPSSVSIILFSAPALTLSYLPVSPHSWWWSESRSHLLPSKSSAALLPPFCLLMPLLGPRCYLYLSIHPSIHLSLSLLLPLPSHPRLSSLSSVCYHVFLFLSLSPPRLKSFLHVLPSFHLRLFFPLLLIFLVLFLPGDRL